MERTCLSCGHGFVEDPRVDDPAICPVCESADTVGADIDDQPNEEDVEGLDDGVWQ